MNIREIQVMNFYKSIGIIKPDQLSISSIAERLGFTVTTWEHSSEVVRWNDKVRMFLNESLNERQLWQEFGHEMKHVFYDVGRQEFLPNTYVYFQECKADHFAYHFCVPTFMLNNLLNDFSDVTVIKIMNLFNVEYDFALRRLEMYESKVLSRQQVAEKRELYLS